MGSQDMMHQRSTASVGSNDEELLHWEPRGRRTRICVLTFERWAHAKVRRAAFVQASSIKRHCSVSVASWIHSDQRIEASGRRIPEACGTS